MVLRIFIQKNQLENLSYCRKAEWQKYPEKRNKIHINAQIKRGVPRSDMTNFMTFFHGKFLLFRQLFFRTFVTNEHILAGGKRAYFVVFLPFLYYKEGLEGKNY